MIKVPEQVLGELCEKLAIQKDTTKTLSADSGSYQGELDFFYHWCKNPTVKQAWIKMRK